MADFTGRISGLGGGGVGEKSRKTTAATPEIKRTTPTASPTQRFHRRMAFSCPLHGNEEGNSGLLSL
jgi:hypothetical protein